MPRKKTTKRAPAKKKAVKKKVTKKSVVKKKAPVKKKVTRKKTTRKKVLLKKNVVEKKVVAPVAEPKGGKAKKTVRSIRGMNDLLPKDELFWRAAHHAAESVASAYNFSYMETPTLEEASLFVRGVGKGTDVVDKEMYIFEDRDGSKLCLRPENTASVVRAYIEHGMHTKPQPVKVWYYGSMFRHDRPQAGRYRQFRQFGCETIGIKDPVADAELIIVAYNFFRDLGIETQVHVNSIGTLDERQNYIIELVAYLRSKRSYLCDDCKRRINKNPLRALDCKQESCQPVKEEAPQIIDWLSENSKQHFMSVLEYLDEMEIPYVLDSSLVRGLDYYTDTVFEFYEDNVEQKSQNALGGGGRYDGLAEQLGGEPTPGCGFSMGIERTVSVLKRKAKESESMPVDERKAQLFFAQLGKRARQRGLKLLEDLRRDDITLYHNFGKSSLKAQMEQADKYGATHTIILGQKEMQDGTIIIRDMESGIQEIVDQNKLRNELKKIIDKHGKKKKK